MPSPTPPYKEISLAERNKKLASIRKWAKLLDSQFKIPGTNFTFGIDPLLDFIPIIGSFTGFITGFILIFMARNKGARGLVLVKMIGNILLDFFIGIFPIIGNIGDFIFKANEKNLKLLEEHFIEDKHSGSGLWLVLAFISLSGGIILGILYTFNWLLEVLINGVRTM